VQRIQASIASEQPQLEALYRHLHAHPELAFQETQTAARLATEMRALGFEVTEQVGKTGLVAIYRNGAGPTVMVRTDLDGLPMEERSGLPYASRATAKYGDGETFVTHACGHDLHMSIWVGTAQALVAQKGRWRGTLMFVGQPAEESVRGARAMLEDGLFTRFGKPDAGFGLHVMPIAAARSLPMAVRWNCASLAAAVMDRTPAIPSIR
jgi:hippurate hydrolase